MPTARSSPQSQLRLRGQLQLATAQLELGPQGPDEVRSKIRQENDVSEKS